MTQFGSYLRERRKALGVSLEQISAELRIRLVYLEALEDEKYELLPTPLYKKIFLKAYADYLGLDFEELWNKVSEKKECEFEAPGKEKLKPISMVGKAGHRDYNFLFILAGIALGVMLFFVFIKHKKIGTFFQEEITKPGIEEAKMGLPGSILDTVKPESEFVKKEKPVNLQPQGEEMTLGLEGIDKSWALVIGDGDTLFSGFINNGMKLEFKARDRFKLTLGRAWTVKGYLNGKKLKPFGPKWRSVFGKEISRDNYKDFLDTSREER